LVAIVGGTGAQGRGLAVRFAAAGISVTLGSRDVGRAAATAEQVTKLALALAVRHADSGLAGTTGTVTGASNADSVDAAAVVLIAVPWDAHAQTLADLADALAGKVVIDCVNPLGFDKQGAFALSVSEGSAAQQAAALLPQSRVVAAFNHVSAVTLADPAADLDDSDVLVIGDDRDAVDQVVALASAVPGLSALYAGRLRNAHQIEALTANIIAINRRYKAHTGVRITGLERS